MGNRKFGRLFWGSIVVFLMVSMQPMLWATETETDYPKTEISPLYERTKGRFQGGPAGLERNKELLKDGYELIKKYPNVPETAEYAEIIWRRIMLPVAEQIYNLEKNDVNKRQLIEIAERVAKNPKLEGHKIETEKIHAEEILLYFNIFDEDGNVKKGAATEIDKMLSRYPDDGKENGLTASATVAAARLAYKCDEKQLFSTLATRIEKKYLKMRGAVEFLCQCDRAPLFEAEMITIDGKKLKFPEDTKGKVVVIDFWATWCNPCRASLPHFKEIWQKYQGKDVLFISDSGDRLKEGESLSSLQQRIKKFTSENGYNWTQAASGSFVPSGVKYGVGSIPHVMVIDKNGRINTYQARAQEERAIEKALKVPVETEIQTGEIRK